MRRRLRYQVAMSLDGFIAGPNGEYDWIVMDPSIDFRALYGEFDTAVMGRKTYEAPPGRPISAFPGSTSSCSRELLRLPHDAAFASSTTIRGRSSRR